MLSPFSLLRQRRLRYAGAMVALGVCVVLWGSNGQASGPRSDATRSSASDGLLLSRCVQSANRYPAHGKRSVHIRSTDYSTIVYNLGSSRAFTVLATSRREITVEPSSGAWVKEAMVAPLRFPTQLAARHWRESGSPVLVHAGSFREYLRRFGFLPNGAPLTIEAVWRLPSSPSGLRSAVRADLAPHPAVPSSRLWLKQYGYLLAEAPLSPGARAAALIDVETLAGAHACTGGEGMIQSMCATGDGYEAQVVFNLRTCNVRQIIQRVRGAIDLFPGLRRGAVVEAKTFPEVRHASS